MQEGASFKAALFAANLSQHFTLPKNPFRAENRMQLKAQRVRGQLRGSTGRRKDNPLPNLYIWGEKPPLGVTWSPGADGPPGERSLLSARSGAGGRGDGSAPP